MKAPHFLTRPQVLAMHESLIDVYGGIHGLRDALLLDSALAQPQSTFDGQFLHADAQEMAAAYAFHLVGNHPFLDGNKRIGAACMSVFLQINGLALHATHDELEELIMAIASGQRTKAEISAWVRHHAVTARP